MSYTIINKDTKQFISRILNSEDVLELAKEISDRDHNNIQIFVDAPLLIATINGVTKHITVNKNSEKEYQLIDPSFKIKTNDTHSLGDNTK